MGVFVVVGGWFAAVNFLVFEFRWWGLVENRGGKELVLVS